MRVERSFAALSESRKKKRREVEHKMLYGVFREEEENFNIVKQIIINHYS